MHLALGCKARFISPILTTFKMTNFSNVIRPKELKGNRYVHNDLADLTEIKCSFY